MPTTGLGGGAYHHRESPATSTEVNSPRVPYNCVALHEQGSMKGFRRTSMDVKQRAGGSVGFYSLQAKCLGAKTMQ